MGRSGSRNAARARARASIGSDLPGVRPLRRVRAISLVRTRTTVSPAASRSASSRRVTCRQSSRAKRLLSQRRAQVRASRWPSSVAATDEVALTLNKQRYGLWRAVDQDGIALDILIQG